MPAPASPPGQGRLEEFKKNLNNEWKYIAPCGREYVNVFKLRAWMRSKAPGSRSDNLTLLLLQVWGKWGNELSIRPAAVSISANDQCAILVFSILLELDHGHLIEIFQHETILDKDLDTDLNYLYIKERLEEHHVPDPDMLLRKFEEKKWSYCPVVIKHGMSPTLHGDRWVIPFCKREPVNEKGGTAQVCQVLIQEDFVSQDLRDRIKDSKTDDQVFGPCYQLALKTYPSQHSTIFKEEIKAFRAIQGKKGMVQYFGNYSLDKDPNDNGSPSHNILLEYGEQDLDEFFASLVSYPPVRPSEIIDFWRSLFKVAEALKSIHILNREQDGHVDEFYGWHADVKPDNILRVHGEFKLADFGFAKLEKRGQGRPMSFIDGGTQTFGAPETDIARNGTRTAHTQTIDTWSFGCVLSVAATWIILGFQGVLQYTELRKQGVKRVRNQHNRMPTADDAFHNGREILPEVRYWHNYLRSIRRHSDTATSRVLDHVETTMLRGHPEDRADSTDLCGILDDILAAARDAQRKQEMHANSRGISTHEYVLKALLTVDTNSPANSSQLARSKSGKAVASSQRLMAESALHGSRLNLPHGRNVTATKRIGKSERLDNIPLAKTAHRAELLQKELEEMQDNTFASQQDRQTSEASRAPDAPQVTGIFESPEPAHEPDLQGIPEPDEADFRLSPSHRADSYSPMGLADPPLEPRTSPSPLPYRTSNVSLHLQDPRTPPPPRQPIFRSDVRSHQDSRMRTSFPNAQSPRYFQEAQLQPRESKGKQPQQPLSPPWSEPATPGVQRNTSQRTPPQVDRLSPNTVGNFGPPLKTNTAATSQNTLVEQSPRLHNRSPSYHAGEPVLRDYYDVVKVRNRLEAERDRIKFWKSPKADQFLEKFIVNRDMIFIVDNGDTMGPWWKVATYVIETLAMKLAPLDDDGLDLMFTIGHESPFNAKGRNAFKDIGKKMLKSTPIPGSDSSLETKTNMAESLGRVFGDYINRRKQKRMTLLVLSDGLWRGMANPNAVQEKIFAFVKHGFVQNTGGMEDRRFSISFIQFGNDPQASSRLRWLDDQWSDHYKLPDMIDHVQWTGSVKKMILGSIEESADMDEDEEPGPVT